MVVIAPSTSEQCHPAAMLLVPPGRRELLAATLAGLAETVLYSVSNYSLDTKWLLPIAANGPSPTPQRITALLS